MAKTLSIKPEEKFARDYADRLILEQLSHMEAAVKLGDLAERLSSHGLGLAAIKSLLASNPERFAYHDRRWVPAARITGEGRPLIESLRLTLEHFGGPMPWDLAVLEVSRIKHRNSEELEPILQRMAEIDQNFVVDALGRVSLTDWGFNVDAQTMERALGLQGLTREQLAEAQEKLKTVDWRSNSAAEQALKVGAPISLKLIGAVAFSVLNSDNAKSYLVYQARDFMKQVLSVPGYVMAPDGTMTLEADTKKWLTAAAKLAERLAPTVDVEDAAPIEVKTDDLNKIIAKVTSSATSVASTKLLEDFYEITPSNKTFPDDMANLMDALKGRPEVQWVGGDRFRKKAEYPEYTLSVPEPFHFVASGVLDEEGEPVDVELVDDGLSSSLRKLLSHPLATDVLDEDVIPALKNLPDSLRLVLKSIHRELGTFPLCQVPTGWFDTEPKMQELTVIDSQGRELQIWVNEEARLTYGWIDWWYEQQVESGAVFSLTKTTKPNVLEFAWLDQPDPVVYISTQRMEELRKIAETAEGRSTLDLIVDVMGHWPKGADYLTILAEVNVVRRSSRRLVASLLSSYQCFYQRSGSPVWHFDAKKLDQGFDKTKKKFIKK